MKPGTIYDFPIRTLDSKETTSRPVAAYADRVYGLTEAGGTQNLMLSGVSFDLLGFNKDIPATALPDLTWKYIAKVPWVFLGVFLSGTALNLFTHRKGLDGTDKGRGGSHD